jgi:glycosyltransferase involved in cell wall biosynthesis
MRVVLWGTYDTGKPRTRLLRRALEIAGIDLIEIHSPVWDGVEDKSQIKGVLPKLKFAMRWLLAYPGLIVRYLQASDHDAIVVGYMGHLDVLVLWLFARLRRKPIIWDAFLSLYDTVVDDRCIVGPGNPAAWALWAWEWLACRAADRVVLDTAAHARLFRELYGLAKARTAAVFVGAEAEVFAGHSPPEQAASSPGRSDDEITVLFYGQFIPLHGIETIVAAAQAARDLPIRWVMIGHGQEEARVQKLIDAGPQAHLEWVPWVPYEELIAWIARADICLGVFGTSAKASRVIPNKVFQILAAGKPLITRDSPAIRELLSDDMPGVYLVEPGNPQALLEAIGSFRKQRGDLAGQRLHGDATGRFTLPALGKDWLRILREVCG